MTKILPRSLYLLIGLPVLLQMFHTVENARGSRAWEAWRKAGEAAGETFDPRVLVPAPVPDADNFAAAPRIAAAIHGEQPLATLPPGWPDRPAGDWRQGQRADLEAFRAAFAPAGLEPGLAAYQAQLDDLAQAARRPRCRLRPTYVPQHASDFPNLLGFRAAARILQLRALVALHQGHSDAAWEDVSTLLRIAAHFRQEPLLLCQLLRIAITGIALQPVWEGLQDHAWTEPQLLGLQGALADSGFLGSISLAWKEERALHAPTCTAMASLPPWSWGLPPGVLGDDAAPFARWARDWKQRLAIPRGWVLQNAVALERATRETVSEPLDPAGGRIDPRRQDAAAARFRPGHSPYTFMMAPVGPAFAEQNIRAASCQEACDQAWTACALERLRRKTGSYPAQLADLGQAPARDVIDGQPLRYRRTGDGGYVLYSVGWNGVDDGGQPGRGKDPLREGDWVWKQAP